MARSKSSNDKVNVSHGELEHFNSLIGGLKKLLEAIGAQ